MYTSPLEKLKSAFAPDPELEKYLFAAAATEEEINFFREEIALTLPELFFDFYRWHNGSASGRYKFSQVALHQGFHIQSLQRVLSGKRMWDELEEKDSFDQYEPGTWWNKAWVPFYYIPDWCVGVLDTQGSYGGKPGQVFSFDFKSGSDRYISFASFDKFLETLAQLKEKDLLMYELPTEEETYNYVKDQLADELERKLNANFAFSVPLWKYRRKEKEENPFFKEYEIAVSQDDLEKVSTLIEENKIGRSEKNPFHEDHYTPLTYALRKKSFPIAAYLLAADSDVWSKDAYGQNAFTILVSSIGPQDSIADTIEILETLLTKGHRLQTEPGQWYDPLHQLVRTAISHNFPSLLKYCQEKGANLNKPIPYSKGNSFLHELCKQPRPALEILSLLIELGGNPDLENEEGQKPIDLIEPQLLALRAFMKEGAMSDYEKKIRALLS